MVFWLSSSVNIPNLTFQILFLMFLRFEYMTVIRMKGIKSEKAPKKKAVAVAMI